MGSRTKEKGFAHREAFLIIDALADVRAIDTTIYASGGPEQPGPIRAGIFVLMIG